MNPRVKVADAGVFLPASQGLRGCLQVPGDKSISHRAVLLGAVSLGPVAVDGFLCSEDTMATVAAVRALGVEIREHGGGLVVHGHGWDGRLSGCCQGLWLPASSYAFLPATLAF
jgi:5-enolpyruvylshikimate-3-phosphate synthase